MQDPFENIKYMVCKSKNSNQIFSFRFDDYEYINQEQKMVMRSYSNLFDIYKNQLNNINPNNFCHMEKTETNTNIIFSTENYLLFATTSLFIEYEEIHNIINECLKIIKNKENYFFTTLKA